MASWTTYKGLDVPDTTTGDAGTNLKDDLKDLADRAPYLSSSNPTVNDDSADGFAVGSQWLNNSTKTMWMCIDASSGAAKWRSLYRRVDNAIVLAPEAGIGSGSDDGRAIQLDDSGDARGTNAVDLQRSRTVSTQVASGDKAAILGGENNRAFSTGSAVAGGKANLAGGGAGTISNIATGNPTTVTSNSHGLATGAAVTITNSNSTPNINGDRVVTVTSTNTFTVPVNVTSSGSAGNWSTETTAPYAFVGGGNSNKASGASSHAEGNSNWASGSSAHAEGQSTAASGTASHAEGSSNTASGNYSHSEGYFTQATGAFSHAEGASTYATGAGAHAEGSANTASGNYAHAEGFFSSASGYMAHAEGGSIASEERSHAEGNATNASGLASHAEGQSTYAVGQCTHAGGEQSKANLRGQWARSSGGFSNAAGTAQTTITHLWGSTASATPAELRLDGSSLRFTIFNGQTLSCFINIVGRKVNGGANDHASFLRQVCIRREGSTTQLVGSVQTIGTDINPAGWGGVSITADDTNEALKIEVTGAASTSIRWMATVMASEAADESPA